MTNKNKSKNWLEKMNLSHPLMIAGPCSAETEEQLITIANQLKDAKVSMLRAGIWKPRTRPGNFEGVGAVGLKWMQQAKKETGLLTATEVANTEHVELALQHDIDVLWVGARSTVSPFIVQEIAEALRGTDKIVLVKNPVNPDLALWLGAVERMSSMNIQNLGVIHRGFSSYEKTKYRNIPQWQIPIDLKNRFPDLPLICDPSHICGRRDLIQSVSQTALDLNFDGLMIETHHTPDEAWSDAAQQITPKVLLQLMDELIVRASYVADESYQNALVLLRTKIDVLDDKIIRTLGKRMQVADSIGELKRENNVSILQANRWKEILEKMIPLGLENHLSEPFVTEIYKAIHQESINHQKKIINRK